MATTARPISELALGIRDTAGAVVASAKVRFYQPGTLTERTVYSDDVCTTPITQPVTCNAGGQATVYTLEPTRMIAKNSGETVTYYDGIVNLNRHDAVYVTSTNINGGAETTLETVLATAATVFGSGDFQYKESSGATARNFTEVIGEHWISVSDFGALGNAGNDDTAEIQAAIDRAKARSVSTVLLPEGTYLISAPLVVDTGMTIAGVGRGEVQITTSSTTTGIFTISATNGTAPTIIRDIGFTAGNPNSGTCITVSAATNGVIIERCSIGRFRVGVACTAVTDTVIRDCVVVEGDGNAAQVGLNLGNRSLVQGCRFDADTDNGSAIKATGTECRITDCYIVDWANGIEVASGADRCVIRGAHTTGQGTAGISISGTHAFVRDCYATTTASGILSLGADTVISDCVVAGATSLGITTTGADTTIKGCHVGTSVTGIKIAGARSRIIDCAVTGATTAAQVDAAANCSVLDCYLSGTTALTVNAGATLFVERDNVFSGTVTNSAVGPRRRPWRELHLVTSSSVTPVTFTPDITAGQVNIFHGSHAAAAQAVTVAAHATATLAVGDILILCFVKTGANNINLTWNAQYTDSDASAMTAATITSANVRTFGFVWTGSAFRNFLVTTDVGV